MQPPQCRQIDHTSQRFLALWGVGRSTPIESDGRGHHRYVGHQSLRRARSVVGLHGRVATGSEPGRSWGAPDRPGLSPRATGDYELPSTWSRQGRMLRSSSARDPRFTERSGDDPDPDIRGPASVYRDPCRRPAVSWLGDVGERGPALRSPSGSPPPRPDADSIRAENALVRWRDRPPSLGMAVPLLRVFVAASTGWGRLQVAGGLRRSVVGRSSARPDQAAACSQGGVLDAGRRLAVCDRVGEAALVARVRPANRITRAEWLRRMWVWRRACSRIDDAVGHAQDGD